MARPRRPRPRPLPILLALILAVVGLVGVYRYWEDYYQHRGFSTVAYLPAAHHSRVVWVHFYSPSLHRMADYLVILPPGYGGGRRYPVDYLLHGSPGQPAVYLGVASMPERLANLVATHRMRPMILVCPDGRIGGSNLSDSEWANTSSGDYASYVIDVVRNVDQRFATIPNRQARVIAGLSAGAYGATNIALHNLATFGELQAWSGYYKETPTGVFAGASDATLRANSPLDYVASVRPALAKFPLRAFLFVGRDDNDSPQTAPMANALAAAGARVSYALYRGGHDWQLWHAHLDQMLILASRDTSRPLYAGGSRARFLTPGVTPLPFGRGRHRDRAGPHARRRAHAPGAPVRPSLAPGLATPRRRLLLAAAGAPGGPNGSGESGARVAAGLLLALGSAALINLGFLFQHRGLRRRRTTGAFAGALAALREPAWLGGQALGWIGFAAQILAVAIAPLSLVQAFAAGGLALSVPLAAGVLGLRITRSQTAAVLAVAAALAILPLGLPPMHERLSAGALAAAVGVCAVAAAVAAAGGSRAKAIAAGILYGAADAAIKAVSVKFGQDGAAALLSGWTAVAALGTFLGFLAFQAALRSDDAVGAISLMNALAALAALACGLLAFGESLGRSPGAAAAHVLAIGVVVGCLPALAAAQESIAHAGGGRQESGPGPGIPLGAGHGAG